MINKKAIVLAISLTLIGSSAMNTKVIAGTITDAIKSYTSTYKEIPIKSNVPRNKSFEVKFNKEINSGTVNSNSIKVVDKDGNEAAVKLSLKASDKKVVIIEAPAGGYKEGETYAVIVRKGVGSLANLGLSNETVMKFVIAAGTTSGGSTGGSTGGTNQTVGTDRVVSVEYKGATFNNTNQFDSSKTYAAVANNNLLNKDKLLVNMSLNGIQPTYYNVIADYEKSQGAFEKVDILEPILMKEEDLTSSNITVNFATDIDTNSIVNGSTVYCIQKGVDDSFGFGDTKSKRNIVVMDQRNNALDISITNTGTTLIANNVNYLFLNGIKDKKGNTLKPMIIPIYISSIYNRSTVTSDTILSSKPGNESWEWVSKIIGINCTSLKFKNDAILDWDRISVAVNNDFSNYQDLIKEVRNRLPRYEIMFEDMRNTGVFPVNGLKVGTVQFKNALYIWDRFTYNGKNVDVMIQSNYNYANVNIYDRGSMWISNPNGIADYGIPFKSIYDKPANWQYNFNKATMDSWTYK